MSFSFKNVFFWLFFITSSAEGEGLLLRQKEVCPAKNNFSQSAPYKNMRPIKICYLPIQHRAVSSALSAERLKADPRQNACLNPSGVVLARAFLETRLAGGRVTYKGVYNFSQSAPYKKALQHLQEGRAKEAQALFSKFLVQHPSSSSARFNLALAFFRETGKRDPARAYLRQILYENPYHTPAKKALRQFKDKKFFWLWIPEDLILSLVALSWLFLIILFFKKRSWLLKGFFLPLFCSGAGLYYFYMRLNQNSLKQDSWALSAPYSSAPALFEGKAGALAKKLSKTEEGYVHVQISGKRGWIKSSLLLPLKRTNKKPAEREIE